MTDCKYLNKKLGCDCSEVKAVLGEKLKTCVKIQKKSNTCLFKKEYKGREEKK